MTQIPDDDDDLASLAPLFSLTFELADQVAAQVTPADTERVIERIISLVESHSSDPE